MESEIKNFVQVWALVITCLTYCYCIAAKFPTGISRLVSLLPIFYLFIILPLNLTTVHLRGFTAFLLVWLTNFKLLLFAFDQGPLSPPPLKLLHFICIACLPIKIKQEPAVKDLRDSKSSKQKPQKHEISKWIMVALKLVLLGIIFQAYNYKHHLHEHVLLLIYCCHVYLQLELCLILCAAPVRAIFGSELEPQFNEPYLATSLQDFWGRRWNLMVTSVLRTTVYNPVRQISGSIIGRKWAPMPAIVASFVVSGFMHEAIYYYITRVPPTWEVTLFFALHGMCLVMEVAVKSMLNDKWRLHRAISGPLVLVFVIVTSVWLFWPQLLRNGLDERVIDEVSTFVGFVKNKLLALHNFRHEK